MSEKPPPVTVTDPITVTIDGTPVEVQKGDLLIDAAERAGTYIPRFCYHPRMQPVGMCRMCLVEVDSGRGPALQPSCMVECTPDMAVTTDSERVKKAQDGVLEFLLINHPLDCPVCDKGGECPLQDQTVAYGPGESRWVEEKRHYPKPIPISETVYLDRERCILCDRCTRFAKDVAGDPLIHFMDRGAATQVNTFPDDPFASYFSGNTVQICPVGALTAKPYRFKARPWDLEQVESTCTSCAVGCRIAVQSSRDEVLRFVGVDSDPVNQGWLCDKGRFSFEAIGHGDRLAQPLVRSGGDLRTARWSEALGAAAAALRGDAGRIAVLGGARLTNEAAYAWARLAKGVVGTDHVDAQLGDGLPAELVLSLPRATIAEVCEPGGTILYLGPDPKEQLPVLFLRLKRAAVEDGARLVELSPIATGLTKWATSSVRYRPGEAAAAVRELLASGALGDGPVRVVLGRPSLADSAATIADAAAVLLASDREVTFLPVLRRGNVVGALDLGLAPGVLPGRRSLGSAPAGWRTSPADAGLDAAGTLQAAADGRIDTLVLLGADPLADFPDRTLAERAIAGARTVIAVDAFLTESNRRADVVLAAAAFAEVDGTTTNIEGRVTTLQQKVTPPGTARADWLLATELAARLGDDFGYTSAAQIWAEIEQVAPAHSGITVDLLRSAEHADGIVVGAGTVAAPSGATTDVPAPDAYSYRLVADRTLYDRGTWLEHSPSSSVLAAPARLRLHPTELAKLGVVEGGTVRVTSNDRSIVVEAVADAGVPEGVAAMAHTQGAVGPAAVIDAASVVTDVRLEVGA